MKNNNVITPDKKTKEQFDYYENDKYEYRIGISRIMGHTTGLNLGSSYPPNTEIVYRFLKIPEETANFYKLNKKRNKKEWRCPRDNQILIKLDSGGYGCPLKNCGFMIDVNMKRCKSQEIDKKLKEQIKIRKEIKQFNEQEEENKKKNKYFTEGYKNG